MASAAAVGAGQDVLTSSKCAFLSLLLHPGSDDADTDAGLHGDGMSPLALGPGSSGSQSLSASQRSSEERESGQASGPSSDGKSGLRHVRDASPEGAGSAKRQRLQGNVAHHGGDHWALNQALALTPSPQSAPPPPALEHAASISLSPGGALLSQPSFSEADAPSHSHPHPPAPALQAQQPQQVARQVRQEELLRRSPLLRMDTGLSESVGGDAEPRGEEGQHLSLSSESLAHPAHALGLRLPEASKHTEGGVPKRGPAPAADQQDSWLCDLGLTLPNHGRGLTPPGPDTGLMVPTPGVYQGEGASGAPVQAPAQGAASGKDPARQGPSNPSRAGCERQEKEKERKKPKIQDLVLFWLRAQKGLKDAQGQSAQGLRQGQAQARGQGQGQGQAQGTSSGVHAKALEDFQRLVLLSQGKAALQERVGCSAAGAARGPAEPRVKREDQPSSSVESGGAGSGSAPQPPGSSPASLAHGSGGDGLQRIAPRTPQAGPGARDGPFPAQMDSTRLPGPILSGGPLRAGLERMGSGAGPAAEGYPAWGEDVDSHHEQSHLRRDGSGLRDGHDIKARSKVEKKRRERISHAFAGLREVVNMHGDMACVLAKATSLIKEQQDTIGGLREQLLIHKLRAGVHPSLDG